MLCQQPNLFIVKSLMQSLPFMKKEKKKKTTHWQWVSNLNSFLLLELRPERWNLTLLCEYIFHLEFNLFVKYSLWAKSNSNNNEMLKKDLYAGAEYIWMLKNSHAFSSLYLFITYISFGGWIKLLLMAVVVLQNRVAIINFSYFIAIKQKTF